MSLGSSVMRSGRSWLGCAGDVQSVDVLAGDAGVRADVDDVDATLGSLPQPIDRPRDDAGGDLGLAETDFVGDQEARGRRRLVVHPREHVVHRVALEVLQRGQEPLGLGPFMRRSSAAALALAPDWLPDRRRSQWEADLRRLRRVAVPSAGRAGGRAVRVRGRGCGAASRTVLQASLERPVHPCAIFISVRTRLMGQLKSFVGQKQPEEPDHPGPVATIDRSTCSRRPSGRRRAARSARSAAGSSPFSAARSKTKNEVSDRLAMPRIAPRQPRGQPRDLRRISVTDGHRPAAE